MIAPEQIRSIRAKAELLAGRSLGDAGDALAELAAQRALAYCGRPDIPETMEQAVAALAVTLEAGEGDVKSVTRGDTALVYFDGGCRSALSALNPFRRLRTVEEGSL